MMSELHEELLRRAYDAFNARDVERALRTMHESVDWQNGLDGGRLRGHREVRDYWQRLFARLESHVEPRRGTVLSDEIVQHRYVISEGLIQRMDIEGPVAPGR
jgi:plasmid stabilization system protein ParE